MGETFEGFVQPTRNYFPMPNAWIDICAEITNLAELKVIQYVLRHTWGYREYGVKKAITTDEFMHGRKHSDGSRMDKGTGLSNRSVIDGLRAAVEHGYLEVDLDETDKARKVKSYSLHMQEMETDVKNLHIENEVDRCEEPSQQICSIFTSDVKDVHSDCEDVSQRSEKDTKEKHLRKTLKKNSGGASAESRAHPQEKSITLSKDEQAFYDLYCSLPFIKVPPPITEKVKEQCGKYAKVFQTQEQLFSLKNWMAKQDYFKGKGFSLALMGLAINDWAMEQVDAQNAPPAPSGRYQKLPPPPAFAYAGGGR